MRVEEDAILEFVSAEFSERVELAYTTLEIEKLSMENVCCVPKPRACPLLSQKTQMGGQVYYIMSRKIIKNRLLANCTPGN